MDASKTLGSQQSTDTTDATRSPFQATYETKPDNSARATENSTVCPGCGGTHDDDDDSLFGAAEDAFLKYMVERTIVGLISDEIRDQALKEGQTLANESGKKVTVVLPDGSQSTVCPQGFFSKMLNTKCSVM